MRSASASAASLAVPALALMWGLNWPAVRIVLSWWSPWTLRFVGLGGAMLRLGERPSPADLGGFVMIMAAAALALLVPHRLGQASRD